MRPMHAVPSALIARNESWVRQQAARLARHLPANVEKADLIQVGLIGVAQAALTFQWEGDPDSEQAREAFVRYARLRVKGAMIDELRQMDHLGRAERRKIKVVQITRERWRSLHGSDPQLSELSRLCKLSVDEIATLDRAALSVQTESLSEDDDDEVHRHVPGPATAQDEVEARVDTEIVMRHLRKFLAALPERDRQVIDAYFGIGTTPTELAGVLKLTTSRLSQLYTAVCERIAREFGVPDHRALGRVDPVAERHFDEIVQQREAQLAGSPELGPWGALMEEALTMPTERFGAPEGGPRLVVDSNTRWG